MSGKYYFSFVSLFNYFPNPISSLQSFRTFSLFFLLSHKKRKKCKIFSLGSCFLTFFHFFYYTVRFFLPISIFAVLFNLAVFTWRSAGVKLMKPGEEWMKQATLEKARHQLSSKDSFLLRWRRGIRCGELGWEEHKARWDNGVWARVRLRGGTMKMARFSIANWRWRRFNGVGRKLTP